MEVRVLLYLGYSWIQMEPFNVCCLIFPDIKMLSFTPWITETVVRSSDGKAQRRTQDLPAAFCTITESLKPLDYGASPTSTESLFLNRTSIESLFFIAIALAVLVLGKLKVALTYIREIEKLHLLLQVVHCTYFLHLQKDFSLTILTDG